VVFPENIGFGKDEYFAPNGDYLSDRLTDEVLEFVEQHRDDPFFVYLPDHAVHAPYNPKPELLAKYEAKAARRADRRDDPRYAATIEAVDQNVGRIAETLERLKLSERTVVIFTSDNGGTPQYTAPLRGSKGQLYEGGIRVPLAISWPGQIAAGTTCDVPVASIDFYPTLLELAQLSPPRDQVQDGESLAPLLRDGSGLRRERLFWHFPCYVGSATPCIAIRDGDFKLIEFFENGSHVELYDLQSDPGEERDLAKLMPDKTAELSRQLADWQESTSAAQPRGANPDYDPTAERPRGGQSAGPQRQTGQPRSRKAR
jgi:arylsulfatase A-like enzyme